MKKHLGKILTCAAMIVTMTSPSIQNIQAATPRLSNTKLVLEEGAKKKLTLKGVKSGIKWKSANTNCVTVSKNGMVYAVKAGNTNVKATFKKKNYICKVTVKEKQKPINNYAFLNEFIAPIGSDNVEIKENIITLIHDVNGYVNYDYENQSAVIDLNGHTWTVSGDEFVGAITITAGNLTIRDSVGTGKITASGKNLVIDLAGNKKSDANLIIESGQFIAQGYRVLMAASDASSITINGGNFENKHGDCLNIQCKKVTITDGYFHAYYSNIMRKIKELTVTGGTFLADGTGQYARGMDLQEIANSKIMISGGTFTG